MFCAANLLRSKPLPSQFLSVTTTSSRPASIPARFVESYSDHIVFVALVYLVCTLPFFNPEPQLHSPFDNTELIYTPVSDYLPPINTARKAQMKPRHGAPKLAKQEILSVPANPDNTHQTIVTPPKVKLDHDVAVAEHRGVDADSRGAARSLLRLDRFRS